MGEIREAWRGTHRRVRGIGLGACLAAALLSLGLGAVGVVPPGANAVEGVYQQTGYTFTGLVFLTGAWAVRRRRLVLGAFAGAEPAERERLLRREAVLSAVLGGTSILWGILYWRMVGWNGLRHSLAFLVLAPVMFLWFMPGQEAWARTQKEVP